MIAIVSKHTSSPYMKAKYPSDFGRTTEYKFPKTDGWLFWRLHDTSGLGPRVCDMIPASRPLSATHHAREPQLSLWREPWRLRRFWGSDWPNGTHHSRELPRMVGWFDLSKIGRVGERFRGPPGFRGLRVAGSVAVSRFDPMRVR